MPREKEARSVSVASSPDDAQKLSPPGPRRFRFPCGHVASEAEVVERLRLAADAVWVACGACGLVVLAAGPAGPRRAGFDNRRPR